MGSAAPGRVRYIGPLTARCADGPLGAPHAPARIRRARVGVAVLFAALGILNGVWAARIPAVKAGLGLSDGALGVALISAVAFANWGGDDRAIYFLPTFITSAWYHKLLAPDLQGLSIDQIAQRFRARFSGAHF